MIQETRTPGARLKPKKGELQASRFALLFHQPSHPLRIDEWRNAWSLSTRVEDNDERKANDRWRIQSGKGEVKEELRKKRKKRVKRKSF